MRRRQGRTMDAGEGVWKCGRFAEWCSPGSHSSHSQGQVWGRAHARLAGFSFALSLFLYQIHLRDLVDSWLQVDASCPLAYTQEAASALVINSGEGLKPCAGL